MDGLIVSSNLACRTGGFAGQRTKRDTRARSANNANLPVPLASSNLLYSVG